MQTRSTCCGSYSRRRIARVKESLPPNPKVQGGVAVIYVGSGNISLKGSGTESMYYASDHNRHFRVHADDSDSILRNRSIILKP